MKSHTISVVSSLNPRYRWKSNYFFEAFGLSTVGLGQPGRALQSPSHSFLMDLSALEKNQPFCNKRVEDKERDVCFNRNHGATTCEAFLAGHHQLSC